MTWEQLMRRGEQRLLTAGIDDAAVDAWLLLSSLTGWRRAEYFLHMSETIVSKETKDCYEALIAKRANRIPVQYIIGKQEFYGRDFYVDERVLIPRQETELLVSWAVSSLPKGARVLDLCTGSGCIAVSLKLERPDLQVAAADLSEQALAVAMKNAACYGAEIEWLQGDLLEPVQGMFDSILSNPPYIATDALSATAPEVAGHEPLMALDGGADGLNFYRKIAENIGMYLKVGGTLFLEIGYDQGNAVQQLLAGSGFSAVECRTDYAGLDRMVRGVWNGRKYRV
ncbi:MAG: peptide chain release factor N(5)-glutamine methyltransferase [Lachnospiraceae bacterium]